MSPQPNRTSNLFVVIKRTRVWKLVHSQNSPWPEVARNCLDASHKIKSFIEKTSRNNFFWEIDSEPNISEFILISEEWFYSKESTQFRIQSSNNPKRKHWNRKSCPWMATLNVAKTKIRKALFATDPGKKTLYIICGT